MIEKILNQYEQIADDATKNEIMVAREEIRFLRGLSEFHKKATIMSDEAAIRNVKSSGSMALGNLGAIFFLFITSFFNAMKISSDEPIEFFFAWTVVIMLIVLEWIHGIIYFRFGSFKFGWGKYLLHDIKMREGIMKQLNFGKDDNESKKRH